MELALRGPIAFREFTIEGICKLSENHKHNYDHVTIIINGQVSIKIEGVEEVKEYGPGDIISVPANQLHILKALTNYVRYHCIFSHRDFGGLVSQEYQGNNASYV